MITKSTILSFIIPSAVGTALAYIGNRQNKEAKKRDESTQIIVDFCNDYRSKAQKAMDDRQKAMDNALTFIADLKIDLINDVFSEYFKILNDNFVNFEVIVDIDSSFDKYKGLVTFDKLKEGFQTFKKMEMNKSSSNDYKNIFLTSLACAGFTSAIKSFAPSCSHFPRISIAGSIPLYIGGAFAITGIIKNHASKTNYKNAINYFEDTKRMFEETYALCKSYDALLEHVLEITHIIQSISLKFSHDVIDLIERTQDLYDEFYSNENNKIDAKYLSYESKKKLKNLYLLSQIVYAAFDLPLFALDGSIDLKARSKFFELYNDSNSIETGLNKNE